MLCTPKTNSQYQQGLGMEPIQCKTDVQIDKLFKTLYFTLYYLEESIDFSRESDLGKKPV